MRRLHVPDIGVVAVQDDLAAAGDIDPGDLANAGTLTHGVSPLDSCALIWHDANAGSSSCAA